MPDIASAAYRIRINRGYRVVLPNGLAYSAEDSRGNRTPITVDLSAADYRKLMSTDFAGSDPLLTDLGPMQDSSSGTAGKASTLYAPIGTFLIPKLYALSGQRVITSSNNGAQYARTNARYWSTRPLFITARAIEQNAIPGSTDIIAQGELTFDGWNWNSSMSSKLYLAMDGYITQSAPQTNLNVVRQIGVAIDSNTIFFNPQAGIFMESADETP